MRWSSGSADTVAVNASTGFVTAKAAGQATITAEARQNGTVLKTATSVVAVFSLTAFRIDPAMLTLTPGVTVTLEAKNIPAETDLVEWVSSGENYARVWSVGSASANILSRAAGQATITATAKDASGAALATATCTVTIPSFKINQSNITLSALGETATLTTSNLPEYTSEVTWSSGNPAILTVDAAGLLTVVGGPGVVTITATAEQYRTVLGTATCQVTVTVPPAFKIDQSGFTLSNNGDTATLTASNEPEGTASVVWSSGNPAILTVDAATGLLTVVGGPGNVTITAKAMPASGSTPLAEATCPIAVTYGLSDVLAVLINSGESTETYLEEGVYTLANVIDAAIGSATAGTASAPSKIMLIAGKVYSINAMIETGEKNLQISTYSSGTASIKRSDGAKNYSIIRHSSGTLILGDGVTENRLVLDGEGGNPSNLHQSLIWQQGGTIKLKDGIEITGGTRSGVYIYSGDFYMEGGVIRGNKSSSSGGGIDSSIGNIDKTGGTIYGFDGGVNANTATPQSDGSAVRTPFGKKRNTTAGPEVMLNTNTLANWE